MRIFFIVLVLFGAVAAQSDPQRPPLTPKEKTEASQLAATFVTAFENSSDISPLIDNFFIADFGRRNKLCRTVGKCGGTDRDFWGVNESLSRLGLTENELREQYSIYINIVFLYSRCIKYLTTPNSNDDASLDAAHASLIALLRKSVGVDAEKIVVGIFGGEADGEEERPKTVDDFRQRLADGQQGVRALRKIAAELRSKAPKREPYSEEDFRVYVNESNTEFFDYPKKTRFLEVWPNDIADLPFKMDIVKEGTVFKIVAVYPPID